MPVRHARTFCVDGCVDVVSVVSAASQPSAGHAGVTPN
jgi:hypothetical protein